MKSKKFLKKLSVFLISFVFMFSSMSTVFAAPNFNQSYWGFWEYQVIDATENIETVEGFKVHRQCTRLSGLSSPSCEVDKVGTNACKKDRIVCNTEGVRANRGYPSGDFAGEPLDPSEALTTMDYSRAYNNNEVEEYEKHQYCSLTENYCPGYVAGDSDFAQDQDLQAWDALESGDLGGFLCHSLSADTEGFFGCEEEGGNPSFILPTEDTTFTQFNGDFEAPAPDGYSDGLTENTGIREFVLNVVNFVIGFLGLIAVIALIYGGFLYITAGGDESKTEKGKNSVVYALMGIILILGSFALVTTVICFAPVGGDDQASFCNTGGGGGASTSGELGLTENLGASVTTTYESAQQRLREIGEGALEISTDYLNIESATEYLPTIEYGLQGGLDEGMRVLSTLRRSVNDFPASLADINFMINYLGFQNPIAKAKAIIVRSLYTNVLAIGFNNTQAAPNTLGFDVYDSMELYSNNLMASAGQDYEENIDKYLRYADGLIGLFSDMTSGTGSISKGVKEEMTDVKNVLELLRANRADRDYLTELIKEINEAAEIVENLEFVQVQMNSSVRSCSAPCVALFDSIGSLDPSGQTILDSQHSWDLDGDGSFDENSTSCDEQNSATVSCIYGTPGTYVITLKVDSADRANYASGIAIATLKVTRPRSQIKVDISSNLGVEVNVLDYTQTPAIINGRAKFTVEEARDELTFDASGSLGGSGNPVEEFVWSFGGEKFGGSNPAKSFAFTQEGAYRVILEVVENGLSERVVLFLEIGSPSSNFEILGQGPGQFQTGQTVSFDGSYSKSDNGAITEYVWTIFKNGQEVDTYSASSGLWSYTPTEPGEYSVRLQVIDSIGERDLNEHSFQVESQTPQACFTYEFMDDNQPGTATFRDCSTDPDGDALAYLWVIPNGEFIDGTDSTSAEPVFKFDKKGAHTVSLSVNDQYIEEELRKEDFVEQDIEVESVLDIILEVPNGIAYQLDETTGNVEVSFEITSDNAVAYEMDYEDGNTDGADGVGTISFDHTYNQSGVYQVKATVFDSNDKGNSVTKKIFIGEANAPLPVLNLKVNSKIIDTDSGIIEVPRETSITFDGSDSLNTDGTGRRLIYLISYGDGIIGSQEVTTHIYEDVGTYDTVFTVTDEDTGAYSSLPLTLNVIDSPPEIHNLSSSISSGSLETPVDINVEVDAEDIDGQMIQYTWSLFDANNTSDVLETQVSNISNTSFTFHGLGTTGEEHRVGICVKVKDDGGNETDSCTSGPYTYVMTVTGQNEPPVAKFSVADSNVLVGDPVIFYDESTDDNEIVEIFYDVLGNGFADDTAQTEHSFSHIYEKVGKYKTRIKVLDQNGAASVFGPIDVIVNSSVAEPVAKIKHTVTNLQVDFEDQSVFDPETSMAFRAWDFDANTDSDGDGTMDNDVDSEEATPSHNYPSSGLYTVKLTVTDMQGNVDSVEKQVEPLSEPLQARLLLTPAPEADNVVHLKGEQEEVRTDVSTSTGPITRYVIDGNINYDSDGDGIRANDADYDFPDPRQGLFVYRAEWVQPFTMQLTVYDAAGNVSVVAKQIVFDPPEPVVPPVPVVP